MANGITERSRNKLRWRVSRY